MGLFNKNKNKNKSKVIVVKDFSKAIDYSSKYPDCSISEMGDGRWQIMLGASQIIEKYKEKGMNQDTKLKRADFVNTISEKGTLINSGDEVSRKDRQFGNYQEAKGYQSNMGLDR